MWNLRRNHDRISENRYMKLIFEISTENLRRSLENQSFLTVLQYPSRQVPSGKYGILNSNQHLYLFLGLKEF